MPGRIAALRKLRHAISAQLDTIVETISEEVGKPRLDALAGDVMTVLECLRYHEHHAARIMKSKRVAKPAFLFRGAKFQEYLEPHGVILVIAPWNYPFQLAMVPAITALVAGNAVILKCSEQASKTATIIAKLFRESGFGEDLVHVGAELPDIVSKYICERPDLIFFTGSTAVGRLIAAQAAALTIPTILELGGKDACIVFGSGDLERAIDGVCYAAFSNAGQVCVGAKRIYVQRSIWEPFLAGFIQRSSQLRIGNSFDSDMGRVRESVRARLVQQVDDAKRKGAVLHTHWDSSSDNVSPLILTSVPHDAEILTDESFGPVVCVAPFEDEEEAIHLANDSEFALSASVYTEDRAQGQRVASKLSVGSCTVNDSIRHVGNPYAAFGGNGQSGYGRYHGAAGLYAFSRIKLIMGIRKLGPREVHWFPFARSTYNGLRSIMLVRHAKGSIFMRLTNFLQNTLRIN